VSTGSGEPPHPLSRRRLGVAQAHGAGHGSRRACWQGRYPRSWPSGGNGPSEQSSPDYGSTPACRTQAAAQTTATSPVEQVLLLVAGPRQGALWWFRASPGVCTTWSMSNSWPRDRTHHVGDAAQVPALTSTRGWDLELVADEGLSGKNMNRPALQAALGRLDCGEADTLISIRLDRISRSIADFAGLLDRAGRKGWGLVLLSPALDLADPAGRFTANVLASAVQYERERHRAHRRPRLDRHRPRPQRSPGAHRPRRRCVAPLNRPSSGKPDPMTTDGVIDPILSSESTTTSISVRGEAQRTVAPDEAQILLTASATSDSKSAATSQVQASLPGVLTSLAQLGGEVLTAQTTRAPLTWSTQSIQTQEEYDHDKISGAHGPTGRHQASVAVQVTVRDFSLLAGVAAALTSRDSLAIHSVSWSVDEDNTEWALVRADAIQAALLKGRDYAAALGGTVVKVEHVADAGLLSGDRSGRIQMTNYGASSRSLSAASGEDLSLDPPPQILSATIEARFAALVRAIPVTR